MNDSRKDTPLHWTALVFDMEVTSPSNRLYRNGRQQAEVTIKLRATDVDNRPVPLSETERASVRLIDYNSGVEIAPVPASGTVTTGWGTTAERNEFAFYPGDRAAAASQTAASGYEFFVRYAQTVDASPKRFGCQVTRDGGVVFKSNDDAYKEFVELFPERLPSADGTRSVTYPWDSRRIEGGSNEWDLTTVDYYYCGLSINGSRIALLTFDASPPSIFQWESGNPASDLFSFTGVGAPGSDAATYVVPSRFTSRTHRRILEPRRGQGVVVLVRHEGIRQDSGNDTKPPPINVVARDEFGTDHLLRVSFKSSANRNELVLTER
ncbi:hypothetical protein [Burkholderia stagnalis]|uniref:Uncharacterized protein n=1 Tax=Burkholderia stagnalis TaxID=1503054 RepID=A0ABX9YR25_9BURK|nr:hypothetical protein [Burkholderia stagnalis]RQQ59965.1 hypothetical protein DF158_13505 [Burkholderia stagnalis]RQQ69160.1 hypothetical protein DF137_14550 [Burkholderia stagnalis]RQQ81547.1 hypothetical protein DF138_12915 [Burkholderia stagnalis]RQQ82918.1 hypothetical protein DF134_29095 [Burkholderia stagnalis]RQQ90624.1 hypothetical protein DF136_14060 [Burkholderia stagnalis]